MTDVKALPADVCGYKVLGEAGRGVTHIAYIVGEKGKEKVLLIPKDASDFKENGIGDLVGLDIGSRFRHPHILPIDRIVSQGCPQGIARLYEKYEKTLSDIPELKLDASARLDIAFEMICGFLFLHNKYCHFDIKPNNILLRKEGSKYHPVITDFGLSTRFDDPQIGAKIPGRITAANFRAPEAFKELGTVNLGTPADVWSIGIVLEYLFSYEIPHELADEKKPGQTQDQKIENYIHKWYSNDGQTRHTLNTYIDTVPDAKLKSGIVDLITSILQLDPTKRPTLQEVIKHPVFAGRTCIGGEVIASPEPTFINPAGSIQRLYRLTSEYLQSVCRDYVPYIKQDPMSIVFLAADLIYRSAVIVKEKPAIQFDIHTRACMYIAWKYYTTQIWSFPDFVTKRGINKDEVHDMEKAIVVYLEGRIYRPYVYDACASYEQVRFALRNILPYAELYLNFTPAMLSALGVRSKAEATIGEMLYIEPILL